MFRIFILIIALIFPSAPALAAQSPELDAILSFDNPKEKPARGAALVDDPYDAPVPDHQWRNERHGNTKTLKYHNQFCDHYDCKTCTKIFKTKKDAEKAGYVPCGKCGG